MTCVHSCSVQRVHLQVVGQVDCIVAATGVCNALVVGLQVDCAHTLLLFLLLMFVLLLRFFIFVAVFMAIRAFSPPLLCSFVAPQQHTSAHIGELPCMCVC